MNVVLIGVFVGGNQNHSYKQIVSIEKRFNHDKTYSFIQKTMEGGNELVVGSTAGLTGYNPDNGKENWHYNWKFKNMALRTVASPIAHQGMIFQNSGDGSGERDLIATYGPPR